MTADGLIRKLTVPPSVHPVEIWIYSDRIDTVILDLPPFQEFDLSRVPAVLVQTAEQLR